MSSIHVSSINKSKPGPVMQALRHPGIPLTAASASESIAPAINTQKEISHAVCNSIPHAASSGTWSIWIVLNVGIWRVRSCSSFDNPQNVGGLLGNVSDEQPSSSAPGRGSMSMFNVNLDTYQQRHWPRWWSARMAHTQARCLLAPVRWMRQMEGEKEVQ